MLSDEVEKKQLKNKKKTELTCQIHNQSYKIKIILKKIN